MIQRGRCTWNLTAPGRNNDPLMEEGCMGEVFDFVKTPVPCGMSGVLVAGSMNSTSQTPPLLLLLTLPFTFNPTPPPQNSPVSVK